MLIYSVKGLETQVAAKPTPKPAESEEKKKKDKTELNNLRKSVFINKKGDTYFHQVLQKKKSSNPFRRRMMMITFGYFEAVNYQK